MSKLENCRSGLQELSTLLEKARYINDRDYLPHNEWVTDVGRALLKLPGGYGYQAQWIGVKEDGGSISEIVAYRLRVLHEMITKAEQQCDELEDAKFRSTFGKTTTVNVPQTTLGTKIFIGHGASQLWRELKDYLKDDLKLSVDEFNMIPAAGKTITDRLKEMLQDARLALVIMTGEDHVGPEAVRARQNVVHEVGLFQGRLGFENAIVLLEEGCDKFSNIDGIVYISFPKGRISASFHEVSRLLKSKSIIA